MAAALFQLVGQAGTPGATDRREVARLLQALLTPAVCRRLGIYSWPDGFLLSILVPAYNEARTIRQLVEQIDGVGVPYEIVAIDDASTDGTGEILDQLAERYPLRVIHHRRNQGKGAALRSGIRQLRGQVVIIQDADLEYDPHDYPLLLGPIVEDRADVVYGSRFSSNHRPVARYWHQTANRLVTWVSNMFTNLKLTDVETCYKVIRRELIEQIGPSLRGERIRHRTGNNRKTCQNERSAVLRAAYFLFASGLCRGKEDWLARCVPRSMVRGSLPDRSLSGGHPGRGGRTGVRRPGPSRTGGAEPAAKPENNPCGVRRRPPKNRDIRHSPSPSAGLTVVATNSRLLTKDLQLVSSLRA